MLPSAVLSCTGFKDFSLVKRRIRNMGNTSNSPESNSIPNTLSILVGNLQVSPCTNWSPHLRGGTRKVGKQERNRRKNEGERAGKKNKVESGKSDAAIFFPKI